MRRPMKPFLTEYKSSQRRPKDAFDTSQTSFGSSDTAFDSGGHSPRGNGMPSEDSYEAAMRAADALFSAPASPKPSTKASIKPSPSPATPSTKAFFSDASPPEEQPFAPEAAGRAASAAGGGRILRAIEETPVDPFAALEAERAPKRRGRKPGSKNKPKLPVTAMDAVVPAHKPKLKPSPRHEPKIPVAIPAILAAPASPPVMQQRSTERFAWVRTSLRPGEKWKRRIPKVAW